LQCTLSIINYLIDSWKITKTGNRRETFAPVFVIIQALPDQVIGLPGHGPITGKLPVA
jgi:hypothetical protein